MQIVLPWPPSCLSPNQKRKSHWRKYAPATKAYRETCGWEAKAQGATRRNDPALHLSITFLPPDARHRDLDGMLGAFKAGLDGISDVLGVDDSKWSMSIRKGEKTKGGAVVVDLDFAEEIRG